MYCSENEVIFSRPDKFFVKKFGIMEAARMVADFKFFYDLPFIYDTYQLAAFFSMRPKEFFEILRNIDNHYVNVKIPKRSGGVRDLNVPDEILKMMQELILKEIVEKLPISEHATAYHKGARLYDNAKPHCNNKYLLKVDIEDFFGSIQFEQVFKSAFNSRYFPNHIGAMLTTLCTFNDVLPQGAPTSPALSNVVMRNFDKAMGRWCKKMRINYSRYCDDLTFSSNKPLFIAYSKAKSLLNDMGFEINERKTHFVTNASRQCVTGLTVNEKVSVSSDYKRKLRQEVYYVVKYGFADAIRFADRQEFICGDKTLDYKYFCNLMCRIQYVLQIEPDNNAFKKSAEKIKLVYVSHKY